MKSHWKEIERAFENKIFSAFVLFTFVLFIYLPVIDGYYLHTDDYFWSYWGKFSCKGVVNWILPIGRPLAGFIYCLFALVDNFRMTGLFRLFAVLNVGLIAFLIWKWLTLYKLHPMKAAVLSLLIVTLPAFQVFVSYISTVPHGLAVTFSLFSLFCASNFVENRKNFCFAVLFLIIALSLNQASALYFIAGLSASLLLVETNQFSKYWIKKLFLYAVVLCTAMLIYYVVFRISSELFNFRNVGKYDGRNFVTNYAQRYHWFLAKPLFEASSLWFVNPSHTIQRIVGLFIFIAFWREIKFEKNLRESIIKITTLFLLIPIGYGISLVSSDPSTEYRTYASLGSFFIIYLFLPFLKRKSNTAFIFSLLALLIAAVTANQNVTKYFVNSDSMEFRFLKNEIRNYVEKGNKLDWINVVLVSGPIAVRQQRNEVGEPTVRHTPNIEPMILAALSELKINQVPKMITTSNSLDDIYWTELTFNHDTIDLKQAHILGNKKTAFIIDMSKVNFQ